MNILKILKEEYPMKTTDLDMLKAIDDRLSGVQHRKAALQKFVQTLDTEEQLLMALRKTYKDSKELYDLIEDEPLVVNTTPNTAGEGFYNTVAQVKPTPVTPSPTKKTTQNRSKRGELMDAILIALESLGESSLSQIHHSVSQLLCREVHIGSLGNSLKRLMDEHKIIKTGHGKYTINSK